MRADLLTTLDHFDEARPEFERAASLTRNGRERELLVKRPSVRRWLNAARASIYTMRGCVGIGILTVYDVATGIGAHLDLAPEWVYLHAGTADGAVALGFDRRGTLDRMDLPRAFRRLRAYEVEDCICIYKNQLNELAQKASRHL